MQKVNCQKKRKVVSKVSPSHRLGPNSTKKKIINKKWLRLLNIKISVSRNKSNQVTNKKKNRRFHHRHLQRNMRVKQSKNRSIPSIDKMAKPGIKRSSLFCVTLKSRYIRSTFKLRLSKTRSKTAKNNHKRRLYKYSKSMQTVSKYTNPYWPNKHQSPATKPSSTKLANLLLSPRNHALRWK